MSRKNTYTGIMGVQAWCEGRDCGWSSEARNALGNAARHADAHPDHEVHVEQTLGITYNRRSDEQVFEDNQRCYLVGLGTPHEPHAVGVLVRGGTRQGQCPGVKV